MTNTSPIALILAGTGKTGARVARALADLGTPLRTAARKGADVHFDWDEPGTHAPALEGADRLYLVPPAASVDVADQVRAFLDLAERSGVSHVTYLSAHGVQHAHPTVALRAVELDYSTAPA